MTYGFRPENWPAFQAELLERAITVADIEKIEFRPRIPHIARITLPHRAEIARGMVEITVTASLRAGRIVEPEPNPIGTELLATRGPPKRIHGEDADTGNGSYKIKGDPSHV